MFQRTAPRVRTGEHPRASRSPASPGRVLTSVPRVEAASPLPLATTKAVATAPGTFGDHDSDVTPAARPQPRDGTRPRHRIGLPRCGAVGRSGRQERRRRRRRRGDAALAVDRGDGRHRRDRRGREGRRADAVQRRAASATAATPLVDVAVDPIDGTTLTAQGKTNALVGHRRRRPRLDVRSRPVVLHGEDRRRSRRRRLDRHHRRRPPRTCAGSPSPSARRSAT